MGITGLLPFVEKASKQCHISEFRGCTVAVDSYCWLHRGAFGCAERIIRGEDTNGYVLYCLKYIKLLQSFGINVILVFDGRFLPAKKLTEDKRRQQRQKAKKEAADLLHVGNIEEARKYMKASINITHAMALKLIQECRKMKVDCIVAPYEADAQLAYLNMKNIVDLVITEDSDLLLFGCQKIFFKMDLSGSGTLVEADKLYICMNLRPDVYTFDKFRFMCILSGCDYLDSLPGIGIKKALKFVSLTENTDIYSVLSKIPSYLKMKNLQVTTEYKEAFMVADATFKHQLVFDPFSKKLVPLTDPSILGTKEDYCKNAGEVLDDEIAFQLALGNLDPFSLKVMDNWLPNNNVLNKNSIWSNNYHKMTIKKNDLKFIVSTPKPAKSKPINSEEIEKQNIEYDLNLEEELQVYNTPITKRKQIEVSEDEDTTSPVIQRNAIFAKKKKLSKFNVTNIDCVSNPVTSRFFSNKKTEETVIKEENPTKFPLTEKCDESQGNTSEPKQICDTEQFTSKFQFQKKTKLPPMLELAECLSNKKESQQDEILKENEDDVQLSSSQKENATSLSSTNNSKEPLKTKLIPYRRVGLSRKRSKELPKNQPTLLNMFGKK